MQMIFSHKDMKVYQLSFISANEIYKESIRFPIDERFSLTSQIRRSSRSICANLAEAFRKRRYEKAFVAKLSDAESEAAETQVWIDFSLEYDYISQETHDKIFKQYDHILGQIVNMINNSGKWIL